MSGDVTAGPADRVEAARQRCAAKLAATFARAGVAYPAAAIFMRAFKHERMLELWAAPAVDDSSCLRLVTSYPVLGASGGLGPKRREGDCQVPEGLYRVVTFNPLSRFHLSLRLDYPNRDDRELTTHPETPGSDIYLHGGVGSTGCLAMGDAAIEEIYLAAKDAETAVVQIFPCRMHPANWRNLLLPLMSDRPDLATHWQTLRENFARFERNHGDVSG